MSAALQIVKKPDRVFDIRFERTFDYKLVREVITNEKIWTRISDDYIPDPGQWKPLENEGIFYVLVWNGDELLGLWTLAPENSICWKIHTTLLPNAWGDKARAAAKKLAEWVWSNTGCMRVITDVPEFNRPALKFAKDCGFIEYGYNPDSFMKFGKLWGQHLLAISRESTCQ